MLISGDSVAQSASGRGLHGVKGTLLADPELQVTDLYNLRTTRNVVPKLKMIADLPIPTTILVDKAGMVRWIDQAEDYMWRSNPERLLAAIEENL